MELFHGFYRAKVVDDKDTEHFGRVRVWIPDLMPEIDESDGIWARPANNPLGGRNENGEDEHYYMGSSYTPQHGAWVFIFFEAGNINRPYFFGALDIEQQKVLPECQFGGEHQKKWVPIKTRAGRTIIVSDDPDDERIEITGKKRHIKEPPNGDKESVWTIDDPDGDPDKGNQTTILFDERVGKEKILIRTHKGDNIHIDIDERSMYGYFANHIVLEAGRQMLFKSGESMSFRAGDNFDILAGENINITALTGDISTRAEKGMINYKSKTAINGQCEEGPISIKAKIFISHQCTDGPILSKCKTINSSEVTDGPHTIRAKGDINTYSTDGKWNALSKLDMNMQTTDGTYNVKAKININTDAGAMRLDQSGAACGADDVNPTPNTASTRNPTMPWDAYPLAHRDT